MTHAAFFDYSTSLGGFELLTKSCASKLMYFIRCFKGYATSVTEETYLPCVRWRGFWVEMALVAVQFLSR